MIFSATTTGRRLGLGLLLAAVFGLGWTFRGAGSAGTNAAAPDRAATGAAAVVWTCSMHPNVRLPQPGQCPICFMDLIPLEPARGSGLGPRDLAMSAAAAALAEIRTEPVQRMFVTKQLRLVGKIAYDETRIRSITARVPGRLEKLHVDQTGSRVRRGQKLAAIYSPELYAAQAELRAALSGLHAVGGDPAMRPDAEATVAAVRDRLRLWGLDEDQVAALAASGTVAEQLAIRSPLGGVVVRKDAVEGRYVEVGSPLYSVADLSRVWVILAAYETDLAWLRTGQPVVFTLPALAGREFTGEIGFIDPVMDDATRTVEVRIAADNSDGELKPGMLVQAVAEATLDAAGRPLDPQSAADGRSDAQPPLVVPASAPLWTGSRSVVYVQLPGRDEPTFSGREVILGPRAGHYYLVASGLVAGERVVTNGNFKIDSALQIEAKPSMMNRSDPAPDAACIGEGLGDLLVAYLPLQAALAGDDDSAAAAAGARVAAAVTAIDCTADGLNAADRGIWEEVRTKLKRAAEQVATAEAIGPRRLALQPLTDSLWTALTRFGYTGRDSLRLFHCPMAMDGAGADWIQHETTTANPYYGAAMLRCGAQTDVLVHPASGAASAAPHGTRPAAVDEREDG